MNVFFEGIVNDIFSINCVTLTFQLGVKVESITACYNFLKLHGPVIQLLESRTLEGRT